MVFEQVASVRLGDEGRTRQLRHRYLALLLEAVHAPAATPLPGPPPSWQSSPPAGSPSTAATLGAMVHYWSNEPMDL